MQTVSEKWKEEQRKTLTPESFIKISYSVTDPEAQYSASASGGGAIDFAKPEQVVSTLDRNYKKYTTLEANQWMLNGSFNLFSGNNDFGYVSETLCDENGVFALRPVITISFPRVFEKPIPGLTITFSSAFDEYATEFVVKAFAMGEETASELFVGNNSVNTFASVEISNYDTILLEIVKWNLPIRRARVEDVLLGVQNVYDKKDIVKYQHKMSADLISHELPENEIVFDLDNTDEKWNPYNPSGSTKYLIERQELIVRYGYRIDGEVEWVKAGHFFMSEWDTPTNGITATFTARSLLEYMSDKFNTTGITNITLYDLAEKAFIQANIPSGPGGTNRWMIDESLKNITVTLPSGFNYTRAEVVQLCANAAQCVMYQDRNGVLRVEPLKHDLTDYLIDRQISYSNADFA